MAELICFLIHGGADNVRNCKTARQLDRKWKIQRDRYLKREMESERDRDRHVGKQIDKETDKQTQSQNETGTDRDRDIQTCRKRQTDNWRVRSIQTDTESERETERVKLPASSDCRMHDAFNSLGARFVNPTSFHDCKILPNESQQEFHHKDLI